MNNKIYGFTMKVESIKRLDAFEFSASFFLQLDNRRYEIKDTCPNLLMCFDAVSSYVEQVTRDVELDVCAN